MENNYAIFILTHGRPNNIKTLKALKKSNYTGRIYFIVDNEDKCIDEYIKLYGDKVMIFDKKKYADDIDEGNTFDERRTITHARNACFEISEKLNIDYFFQFDDDYMDFHYRLYNLFDTPKRIMNIDLVFEKLIEFYKKTNALSIAMSQGGDFIGGKRPIMKVKRKCMNSFLCSSKRKFRFIGAMNEDVNTYTTLGSRGHLFMTIPTISLGQTLTQTQSGGITDMYIKYGTYCKSFTTVMMMPSSVKVSSMGNKNERLHHKIRWVNTVPVIIEEKYKKYE